jgi:Uma2 family endonuclease
MSTVQERRATVFDLMGIEGKAELIAGKVVLYMPTGVRPNEVAGNIYISLHATARKRRAKAFTENMGYLVPELSSGRESFSPDASYYDGPLPKDEMDFIRGAPNLAVEVRSKGDYGRTADCKMAEKRADYFEAGTLVVWDVDPKNGWIDCYRADAPDKRLRFKKGDIADAEPAVPGWRIPVNDVFA